MASIISNATIASTGKVVTSLIGLIITAILTRLLGVQLYGSFILLLSFGTLFQTIADFGLYLVLTKELSKAAHDQQLHVLSTIISIRLLLLIITSVLSLVIGFFIPSIHSIWPWLTIVLVGLFAQSVSQIFMGVYQTYQTMWPATLGDTIGRIIQLIIILIIARATNVGTAAIAFTASTIVALCIYWWYLPLRSHLKITALTWSQTKQILWQAWPFALLLILNVIYFRIDIVMLSILRPANEVGYYGLAYRIIENLLFFPAMFGGLLLPQLSQKIHVKSFSLGSRLLQQALSLGLLASGLIVVILGLLSTPIIQVFSGLKFIPAAPLLSVLGIALAIMSIGNIIGFALVAANKQYQLLRLYLFLVAFNVIMNLIFIPHFGALAAAWITVATELLATSFALRLSARILPVAIPGSNLLKIITISAITAGLILIIRSVWPLIISLPIAIICYAALAHISGLFSRQNLLDLFHHGEVSPSL